MAEFLAMLVQVTLVVGLIYGMLVAFQHGRATGPEDRSFDDEFAHHRVRDGR